jgi:hypothetical protein
LAWHPLAIVQYLLTKNGELKRERKEYEKQMLEVENRRVAYEEAHRMKEVERFVKKDQGAMAMAESSTALVVREDAAAATNVVRGTVSSTTSAAKPTKENSLKQVSYWFSEAQPMHKKGQANYDGEFDYQKEIEDLPPPPAEKSASPMSGQPLKLKQLIPVHLLHEGDGAKSKGTGKVLCAVSHKQITTQPTICIKSPWCVP